MDGWVDDGGDGCKHAGHISEVVVVSVVVSVKLKGGKGMGIDVVSLCVEKKK